MKYCTHCGKETADETLVCTECGCTFDTDGQVPIANTDIVTAYKKSKRSLVVSMTTIILLLSLIFFGIAIVDTIIYEKKQIELEKQINEVKEQLAENDFFMYGQLDYSSIYWELQFDQNAELSMYINIEGKEYKDPNLLYFIDQNEDKQIYCYVWMNDPSLPQVFNNNRLHLKFKYDTNGDITEIYDEDWDIAFSCRQSP